MSIEQRQIQEIVMTYQEVREFTALLEKASSPDEPQPWAPEFLETAKPIIDAMQEARAPANIATVLLALNLLPAAGVGASYYIEVVGQTPPDQLRSLSWMLTCTLLIVATRLFILADGQQRAVLHRYAQQIHGLGEQLRLHHSSPSC